MSLFSHEQTKITGGGAQFYAELTRALINDGHKVYVLHAFNDLKAEIVIDGALTIFKVKRTVPFLFARGLNKVFRKFGFEQLQITIGEKHYRKMIAKKMSEIVSLYNIDIIETTDTDGWLGEYESPIPLILRFHGSISLFDSIENSLSVQKSMHRKNSIHYYEKRCIQNATYLTAVSKASLTYAERIFGSFSKKHLLKPYIYNGIDQTLFKYSILKEKNIKNLCYFGSLEEKKGLPFLINVYKLLIKKIPDITLTLYGSGEKYFYERCYSLLNDKEKKNIHYGGTLSRNELPIRLSQYSVFLFPTKIENFPLSWLEVMSLGRPLIVSDILPAYESVEDKETGYIISTKYPDRWVSKISELVLDYNKNVMMGKRGRLRIEKFFTIEKSLVENKEYYAEVINEKKY